MANRLMHPPRQEQRGSLALAREWARCRKEGAKDLVTEAWNGQDRRGVATTHRLAVHHLITNMVATLFVVNQASSAGGTVKFA